MTYRSSFALALLAGLTAACQGPPPEILPQPDFAIAPLPDLGVAAGDLWSPGTPGWLRVSVVDDETLLPIPSRVIITNLKTKALQGCDIDPKTGKSVNGHVGVTIAPGVIGAPEGVLLISGDGAWQLPGGTYELMINHGPEYEAVVKNVVVGGTAMTRVDAALRHSVDTRGWLSADLHIHSGRGYDSQLALDDRVVTEVVSGVEVLVATDHNVLTSFTPELEMLGYTAIARSITGNEFNFFEGHGGAYPMPYDASAPWGGTLIWDLDWTLVKDRTLSDIIPFLRKFPQNPAITINHPRLQPDLGYFINIGPKGPGGCGGIVAGCGWAPPAPLPTAGQFDALEVMSGYQSNPGDLAVLLRDYFFILNSGHRLTALGSSDTHRLSGTRAGYPRTWLRMPTEDPVKLLDSDLADAVKAGRAVASNGPFALLTVDGKQIGDMVTNTTGSVTVEATVDAPGWVDVDKVRVWINGEKAMEVPVATGLRPVFHLKWVQKLPAGDCWIALSASGSKPLPVAIIGDQQGGSVTPFVLTNPIYIDGDGDKKWIPNLMNPDPGPIPVHSGPEVDPSQLQNREDFRSWQNDGTRPAPIDCEPSLRTDPSTWVNPATWVNP